MASTVKTFCRNCTAVCAMEVDVDQGRLLRGRPDGSVSPYGSYLCPKGLAAVDLHNGMENRLLGCLKRRPDGGHAAVTTEQALDEIGVKLAQLVAKHGPRCVAVYHGTGAYRSLLGGMLERAWVSALGTPNFFSTMTIDQSAKWVTMARMGTMASGKHAFRDADLALLAGGNPVVSHQAAPLAVGESGAPAQAFAAAKARGCKVIVVDPRRTETARYADLLIQPLPGHDAELFAAIAHVMLRDGIFAHTFVETWCHQLDQLRAVLAPFTPEMAARRADVPVEQIETAALWLAKAQKPVVGSGTGPSMADHSNLADHMIEVVGALAGGFRRAGDLVRNPGTLKPRQFFEMAVSPSRSFERGPRCLSHDTGPLMGELPTALLPAEITVDHPDRIRALISFGGDPLMALGDPDVAKTAFGQLDLLVSLDCRMNETGRLADYVVASSLPFERAEITHAADALFPEPFTQYTPAVVPKPEGTVHDWEFFWEMARRMGLPLTLKNWNYGLIYADMPGGLPLSLSEKPDEDTMLAYLCEGSAVSFEMMKASPGGVRPPAAEVRVQPAPDGAEGRLHLCPPDVASELSALAQAPIDAPGFAYRLTCRRILQAINTAYRDSPRTRKLHPLNHAFMNPLDMAEAGIAEGALVEITSDSGAIRTLAKSEDNLRRGIVSMTHMFGSLRGSGDPVADGGGNVGELTSLSRHRQPINFMPRFSGVPVNVRPVVSPPL